MFNIKFHQKAIVLNGENKLLALRAAYKGLKWDLPGGAVELPEGYEEALRREVKEEANIEIKDIVPVAVQTAYGKDDNSYMIFIGYQAKATSEDVKLSGEHTEYQWVTRDEFMDMDATAYLKEFVQGWRGI